MLAPGCTCPTPQVFSDVEETCLKCGRAAPAKISPSTWRLALAIAEVAIGARRVGNQLGRENSKHPDAD